MTWNKQKCNLEILTTDLNGGCLLPKFNSKFCVSFLNFSFHQILRLPNFNMLFQLVLTKLFKSKLFSCLPKVDHMMTVLKAPISYRSGKVVSPSAPSWCKVRVGPPLFENCKYSPPLSSLLFLFFFS